jgi:predicted house-cleaning noncanonical NTP pyrophosphatase (MazG superfamily)
MAVRQVNKLVRDKIPAIIMESGAFPDFRILDEGEFFKALEDKLFEEVEEYRKEKNLEELADIYQVVVCLAEVLGGGRRELEYIADEKRIQRGKFDARIFLESVSD